MSNNLRFGQGRFGEYRFADSIILRYSTAYIEVSNEGQGFAGFQSGKYYIDNLKFGQGRFGEYRFADALTFQGGSFAKNLVDIEDIYGIKNAFGYSTATVGISGEKLTIKNAFGDSSVNVFVWGFGDWSRTTSGYSEALVGISLQSKGRMSRGRKSKPHNGFEQNSKPSDDFSLINKSSDDFSKEDKP